MTIRQEIFNRVVAQLQRISTSNTYTTYGTTESYQTNIGGKVFPWRTMPFKPGEVPALIVRDLDEPIIEPSVESERITRQLHMQVEIVLSGSDSMDELRKHFSDVEAAIGEGRNTVWYDITTRTRPRISRSVLEQTSEKVAGGIFEFYIDYPTMAFRSIYTG